MKRRKPKKPSAIERLRAVAADYDPVWTGLRVVVALVLFAVVALGVVGGIGWLLW